MSPLRLVRSLRLLVWIWLSAVRRLRAALDRSPGASSFVRLAAGDREIAVLRVSGPPRSLDDLALRIGLCDWATGAGDRELVLIRRERR